MICKNCKEKNPDNATFCKNCGEEMIVNNKNKERSETSKGKRSKRSWRGF